VAALVRLDVGDAADRLASNALVFESLLAGIAGEQASWKPEPTQWSLLEVVNHLADEEAEDFRRRLELTLTDPVEPWPSIDPLGWVTARGYLDRELGASCTRFLSERARSVAWLRQLRPDLERAHQHPTIGPLKAGDLLASWLAHDLIHIRQITRLHYRWLERQVAPYTLAYAGPF
jgi:hypothetical protein